MNGPMTLCPLDPAFHLNKSSLLLCATTRSVYRLRRTGPSKMPVQRQIAVRLLFVIRVL
ncbi:hypothetical protein ES702_00115 [subsurface metagenome]